MFNSAIIRKLIFLFVLFLFACSSPTDQPSPTLPPSSTETPRAAPTATATILPSPSPEQTLTEIPQLSFSLHNSSPVLSAGPEGAWDAGGVREAFILFHDATYFLFYTGFAETGSQMSAIGYATSPDGITWEKYEGNPVFQPDQEGFDAFRVYWPVVLVQDGMWVLYYAGRPSAETSAVPAIGRAVAANPSGPWERVDAPVLTIGEVGRWDSGGIVPGPVLLTEEGYRMYFSAFGDNEASIGMATSSDGLTWTKYDDPETTTRQFGESDPVLTGNRQGWDRLVFGAAVLQNEMGWVMFYHGDPRTSSDQPALGYATSLDGILWTRSLDEPIFIHDGERFPQAPSVIVQENTYFLYYTPISREPVQTSIELATGKIP